jgi:GTP-binding protein
MKLKSIEFVGSYPSESKSPKEDLPEYAFIGRSNVGKSTLINFLMQRKEIAKVSSTPGKTQLLNFFIVNESWHLVDLPGYGYAKASKRNRAAWEKMIHKYLQTRRQLQCAFVLIDARIPLQEIDRKFIGWLGESQIPFVLVFTKTDGIKSRNIKHQVDSIKEKLMEEWTELPRCFITSSTNKIGREDILEFINKLNLGFSKQ